MAEVYFNLRFSRCFIDQINIRKFIRNQTHSAFTGRSTLLGV